MMKADLYSKTMLTIIAGALLYLCFAKSPLQVRADSVQKTQDGQPQRVMIVGQEGEPLLVMPTSVGYGGKPFVVSKNNPLPVTNVP